jgi:aryl-alcohol dehydrogenase-like predicted oxidoreductase
LWYTARAIKNYRRELLRARKVHFINDLPDVTAAQVAMAFVLANENVSSGMLGTTSVQHLEEAVAAQNQPLSTDLMQKIRLAVG